MGERGRKGGVREMEGEGGRERDREGNRGIGGKGGWGVNVFY